MGAVTNYKDLLVWQRSEETAKEVGAILKQRILGRLKGKGAASFFVTDAPDRFIKVGRRFLGEKVESAVRIER